MSTTSHTPVTEAAVKHLNNSCCSYCNLVPATVTLVASVVAIFAACYFQCYYLCIPAGVGATCSILSFRAAYLAKDLASFRSNNQILQSENKKLQGSVAQLKELNEGLAKGLREQRENNREHVQANQQLKAEIENLQGEVTSFATTSSNYLQRLDNLVPNLEQQVKEQGDLTPAMQQFHSDTIAFRALIEALKNFNLTNLIEKKQELEAQIGTLSQQLAQSEVFLANLQGQVDALGEVRDQLTVETAKLNLSNNALEKNLRRLEAATPPGSPNRKATVLPPPPYSPNRRSMQVPG